MVEGDLLSATAEGESYQLSSHGRRIKETLDQLPEQEKAQAYQKAWGSPLQRGIKDIRNFPILKPLLLLKLSGRNRVQLGA